MFDPELLTELDKIAPILEEILPSCTFDGLGELVRELQRRLLIPILMMMLERLGFSPPERRVAIQQMLAFMAACRDTVMALPRALDVAVVAAPVASTLVLGTAIDSLLVNLRSRTLSAEELNQAYTAIGDRLSIPVYNAMLARAAVSTEIAAYLMSSMRRVSREKRHGLLTLSPYPRAPREVRTSDGPAVRPVTAAERDPPALRVASKPRDLLTARQVAELYAVSPKSIYRRAHQIPGLVKLPGSSALRWDAEIVRAALARGGGETRS